jgi:hypothetical protein
MWRSCYVLAMPDASSGPVPADEFDRELRELTEGTAGEALFIEPSAAERANGAVAEVRRRPKARKRGSFGGTVFLVVTLMLAGMLGWLSYRHSVTDAGGAGAGARAGAGAGTGAGVGGAAASPSPGLAAPGPAPSVESVLSGTISPIDPFAVPPADPFAGTAADHWADGSAGIDVPAARPVGGFSRAEVTAAYETTRKLLIAANLDGRTLLGAAPTAFAKLLAPPQRAVFLAGLTKTGVTSAGDPVSTRTWVASFAPGSTELVADVIKVHGTMSARAASARGSGNAVLAVDVNYLFSYAVEPPHDPSDWTRVTDHVYGSFDFAPSDNDGGALEPRDRAVITNSGIHGCAAADGYIHPAYPSDRTIDDNQVRPLIHPYSAPAPLHDGGGAACGAATGS